MSGAVQIPLATGGLALPFNPRELSRLTTPERGKLYEDTGLDVLQRAAAEDAVRRVIAGQYSRSSRIQRWAT